MILSQQTLREYGDRIITPFCNRTRFHGMTYGVGPAGYDVRVEFDRHGEVDELLMQPQDFLLASTIERFTMPDDVMGIVHDKSTWARLGLTVQNTVIEPGWNGWLTLELVNHSKSPILLTKGSPIAQVVFHRIDKPVENSYDGKYDYQERGPVQAILE